MSYDCCDEIIDHLFVGSAGAVRERSFVLVVCCTRDTVLAPNGIRIPIDDDPDCCETLITTITETQVLERIHEHILQGQDVLVHCLAGIQRSCTVAAMYLMRFRGLSSIQAIDWIRERRPVAFDEGVNFAAALYERRIAT
jgi:hypothetical protein